MPTIDALVVRPTGDSALILEFGEAAVTIEELLRMQGALERAAIRGVTEITTAFTTLAIFYDPARVVVNGETMFTSLEAQVRAALADDASDESAERVGEKIVEIPVCYDAEFAVDLDEVAAHARLSPAEVIRLHSSADYRVACVGFTPGFPYLSGLPAELAIPRRETPRTTVPPGSVAIGGEQTGIYALSSPGGWHIIGRTPLRLFDVSAARPALLRVGERVRFRAISAAEFHAAASATPVQAPANK